MTEQKINEMPTDLEDEKFEAGVKDVDLIKTINGWIKESEPYHNILLKAQNKALEYYWGKQTDVNEIPAYSCNTVVNRIYEGTETLVPIVTGSAHQFLAMPGNEDEVSLRRSRKVQTVLTRKYEDLEIQQKLEDATRDIILKRFGVLKYFWDHQKDDIGVKVVDPRVILIPKLRLDPHELPYVIEVMEFTKEEIKDQFPKFKDVNKLSTARSQDIGKQEDDPTRLIQVFEVWTDEYVVWKSEEHILDQKPNPYWDFKGQQEDKKSPLKFFNHLDRPQKPYIFMAPFRTGEAPIGPVSIAEVAIPIQDDINTQKRKIVDNLRMMGNGQILIDKGALEEEMQNAITSEPGLMIVGAGVASEGRVQRVSGVQLPSSHFANLQDSMIAFDNIFGVHPTTRGAGESKTLGQSILNRQQDLTRIDLITRVVNRGVARLADGLIQLMKLFYTEQQVVRIMGTDDAVEFMKFSREDIEDNVVVNVKAGQTFPEDPTQVSNRAIQMFQLGALAPVDLYKSVGIPNPEETAERLIMWLQGQLDRDTAAHIAEAQAGAQAKAAAEPNREVETNTNSLQRSERSVTGTEPAKLPKTPK